MSKTVQATKIFGDREAFSFQASGERLTFFEFEERTNRIGANFLSLGLEKGDCIGIWSPNHVEWIETQFGIRFALLNDLNFDLFLFQFAAVKAGLILVNLDPSYKTEELAYALEKCRVKAIVAETQYGLQNFLVYLKKYLSTGKNSEY